MVESLSLNFRVFTVRYVGDRKFRNFTVHVCHLSSIMRKYFQGYLPCKTQSIQLKVAIH